VIIELYENIPKSAPTVAAELGHDVDTVIDEELAGASHPDVLDASTRDDRLLVTLDRGLGDLRSYPPGRHGGIIVLRVESQDASTVAGALRSFLASENLGDLTGCIVVVRGHLARIRRPD